jgi:hypothetical protein
MFDKAYQPVIEGGQFANVLRGDAHFHIGESKASSNRGTYRTHSESLSNGY